jgi:hypothetical protein
LANFVISSTKRNAEVAIDAQGEESANKKQKTAEQVDEDIQPTAVQSAEDDPPEKSGKGNVFKELPYTFLSDGSKHLEQCMYASHFRSASSGLTFVRQRRPPNQTFLSLCQSICSKPRRGSTEANLPLQ